MQIENDCAISDDLCLEHGMRMQENIHQPIIFLVNLLCTFLIPCNVRIEVK